MSRPARALVWFRSDLRLADNPAFHHAMRDTGGDCVGLFIATPRQWERHGWGAPKAGFVLRSARELAADLARRGVRMRWLVCDTFTQVPEALVRIAGDTSCDSVYLNNEPEVNERRRDADAEHACRRAGLAFRAFEDQTVLPLGSVRTAAGTVYQKFTPFRKAWEQRFEEAGGCGVLRAPAGRRPRVPVTPMSATLAAQAQTDPFAQRWPAGEREARRRLRAFLNGSIERYHTERDRPDHNATSELSPYLAAGCLSARQCVRDVLALGTGGIGPLPPGPRLWLTQLIWREFYRNLLVGFPRVSMDRSFHAWGDRVRWRDSPADIKAWRSGRTGYPIVDAAMRALVQTGWMHNRLRMIVASFLTKHLLVDWRVGESWFAQNLVDLDLANNNGGWQWAASTGTDAVPYFRVFNPVTQGRRFDPQGAFIRRWVPELALLDRRFIHEPWRLDRTSFRRLGYPRRICEHDAARQRAIDAFARATTRYRRSSGPSRRV